MTKNTNHSLSKVVYKPDSQSTDEFIVIVNLAEYKAWKEGDKTIPLSLVVDSFSVFHSGQGTQGILGVPSHQQLDTVFGTHNEEDVVRIILEKGRDQPNGGFLSMHAPTNATRGAKMGVVGDGR